MARRSPRKKAISPEAVAYSSDENFNVVASDDQYALPSLFVVYCKAFLI